MRAHRRCGWAVPAAVVFIVTVIVGASARAADASSPTFVPRITLLEVQYPQGVAVSAGTWLRLSTGERKNVGLVGDLGAGLAGVSIALGPGVSAPDRTSYERVWSFGVQGTALRTWPWWSPWLATSRTFVGGQVFASYFAVRCSIGAMLAASNGAPFLVGGCGVGLP